MIKYHILLGSLAQSVERSPLKRLVAGSNPAGPTMSFFTYVLQNSETGKIYIGQTCNLKDRIDRHNGLLKNKLSSFTYKNKQSGIWSLIYFEEFENRKMAIKREKELKSYRGREFIKGLSR